MAGKVHALITRPFTKGRDWYDLLWYRARRPPTAPNVYLLQHALDQTHGSGTLDATRWPTYIEERLARIDMAELLRDVTDFLERPADRAMLTRDNILGIVRALDRRPADA